MHSSNLADLWREAPSRGSDGPSFWLRTNPSDLLQSTTGNDYLAGVGNDQVPTTSSRRLPSTSE